MATITHLGKYSIRRELGKGAMGVVYEGFDPLIERTVAIKTILPQQLKGEEASQVMARFKREAQAAGRLNHPGIVAVYDYGEEVADDDHTMVAGEAAMQARQPIAYIAMEFVQGKELRDYFEANERFALPDVQRLMADILDALDHAHRHGVVHRDIKPANLIVLPDGKVKVADFGIARIEKSELTQVGTVLGTPAYMSPEQFMGQPVDARSDLFSCGVVLYQFLTGEKPFTGNSTTIMFKVLHEEPLAPSMLNVALPPALDAVVKKAMAKNPQERYQSAREFSEALAQALSAPAAPADDPDRTAVSQVNPAPPAPKPAASAAPAPTPLPQGAAQRAPQSPAPAAAAAAQSPKKFPAVAVAAGIAVAVLGGAGLWYGSRSKAPDSSAAAPAALAASNATAAQATTSPAPVAIAATEPAPEPGTLVISALGLANPKDARFANAQDAQAESRSDAMRQLVEKAVALYVDKDSIAKNYAVLERKLLAQPGAYIKTVIQEGAPSAGPDGLVQTEARAVVKVRDVQKSLNQLSKEERIDFIRANGDPKVAIRISIRNADSAQPFPPDRSMVAENVLKDRIKSFGFRVWSAQGDTAAAANAQAPDFQIDGEVKLKTLSARLPSSGLTITKTALTSWTLKATDRASGEEVYLNTVTPSGKSWATEDQALMEIGKLVGDEFSKNFFLEHFAYGAQNVALRITGLPDAASGQWLLRELRSLRAVLDAQPDAEAGTYQLRMAEGNAADLLNDSVLKPLNAKLGQNCLSLAGATGNAVQVAFASACNADAAQGKWARLPPAGLQGAAGERGKLAQRPTT